MRALAPPPASVSEAVAEIVAAVRDGGDRALGELVARFDLGGAPAPPSLRLAPEELDAGVLADDVRAGLEVAITNVALVADAAIGEDVEVTLPQGQRIVLREVPVRRAAVYVPGGRAPYPSTVVMGVVTARAAGVEEVVVLTPPPIDPVIRGACALCGVHEVYAMGGAHGIAALAYGTETIERVDVIAGPGSLIVQEAKRQVSDAVGIDGFYGPSDVLVLADAGGRRAPRRARPARPGRARSRRAGRRRQRLVAAAARGRGELELLGAERRTPIRRRSCSCTRDSLLDALAFSEAFAPEHLELVGPSAERLAPRVRSAGCMFVGAAGGTAFGDYVAGSNHACRRAARRASRRACRRASSGAA